MMLWFAKDVQVFGFYKALMMYHFILLERRMKVKTEKEARKNWLKMRKTHIMQLSQMFTKLKQNMLLSMKSL